jgi:hypothetical protein
MKPNPTYPDVSEFDRIDHLPTLGEFIQSLRECMHSMLGAVTLTWR